LSETVEILINPVSIKILTVDTGLIKDLDDNFKYKDASKLWGKKTKELISKGIIDEYRHLFSKAKSQLPIGFLDETVTFLKKRGVEIKFEDYRKYPEIRENIDLKSIFPGKEMRYYQVEALEKIIRDKKLNGIVEGATAFGKTLVFLALTRLIKERILIIFPGKQLVFQTYKEAETLGIKDIGFVSGTYKKLNERIMLTNYQSLEILEGNENIKEFKTIFVDEMHSAKANTLYNFLKKSPAPIRLGFSATPFKPSKSDALDNALNKANLGEIIYSKKAIDLMKEGFIAEVTIKFLKIDEPQTLYFVNHIEAVNKLIVNNDYRNNIIKELCLSNDKRTLIMVHLREHGEILNKLIPESVMYIHGDTETEIREDVRDKLNSGEIKRILATEVWGTGVNIPNLERIIVACSGKSFYQTIQRIGRGLRKTEQKTHLEVWDFFDVTNKYLEKWTKERWKFYKSENFPIVAVKLEEIKGNNKVNNK
jgi:superfamily II DNA or RNA helicase